MTRLVVEVLDDIGFGYAFDNVVRALRDESIRARVVLEDTNDDVVREEFTMDEGER